METVREGRPTEARVSLRSKGGHFVPVHLRTIVLRDGGGSVRGAVEIFEEATTLPMQDRRQNKLAAFGCLDQLTGILNHGMIEAQLRAHLGLYAVHPVPFCVLCVAIDDLPRIRERFGQAAADTTLRVVAQTMQTGLRPTDFVGRWTEQELLAVLTECGEMDVLKVGERLRKQVHFTGVAWWGDTLHVTISVGATPGRDHDTVESIVGRAEQALAQCNQQGGQSVVVVHG